MKRGVCALWNKSAFIDEIGQTRTHASSGTHVGDRLGSQFYLGSSTWMAHFSRNPILLNLRTPTWSA